MLTCSGKGRFEYLAEVKDIRERVVERRWSNSDYVGLTLVDDNTVFVEMLKDRFQEAWLQSNTQLGASSCVLSGSDDSEVFVISGVDVVK